MLNEIERLYYNQGCIFQISPGGRGRVLDFDIWTGTE